MDVVTSVMSHLETRSIFRVDAQSDILFLTFDMNIVVIKEALTSLSHLQPFSMEISVRVAHLVKTELS